MILDTYSQDQELLLWGDKYYPELRREYGTISIDNMDNYLHMVDMLRLLKSIDKRS